MPKRDLVDTLSLIGQSHVLRYLDEMNTTTRKSFLERLNRIDWTIVDSLTSNLTESSAKGEWPFEPASYFPLKPANDSMRRTYGLAADCGERALREGAVAVFTVAGGQGSRLGWDAPKGTFPITAIKHKSLFQVFAEKIRFIGQTYGKTPHWYLMTSELNHAATVTFFKTHRFFGLSSDHVHFFSQGQLPACDASGKLLLAAKDRLFMSPDGHGGSLKALHRSGAVGEMLRNGIRVLSYFQVDNPLVSVADPLFIGLHLQQDSQVSSRMLPKRDWSEKMGVFCQRNDRLQVVEYSDLPEPIAKSVEKNGMLSYVAGSPAIHLFDPAFIDAITIDGFSLPVHLARKRIPFIGDDGTLVAPQDANGVKFETFVFDAIPMADRTMILEADRRSEFAPVKNSEGEDSPESCRRMMTNLYASWIDARGLRVPRLADGRADCVIEVSPLAARTALDLDAAKLPTTINPKKKVYVS